MDHVNINLTADAKVQPQETDQDIVMLDGVTSESDVDIAQYTPPESGTTSDCYELTSWELLKMSNQRAKGNRVSQVSLITSHLCRQE